jgi:MYXO-CTERM domain-containing protein
MKKTTQLLTLALAAGFGSALSGSIIFSQYVETDSGTTPKAVELWNVSGATIDFSDDNLTIERYANANTTSSTEFTLSSGTLADGDVIVIGGSDSVSFLDGVNGLVLDTNLFEDSFSFNGNDALEAILGGTTTDLFGNIGGSATFEDSGVSAEAQNIQLKQGISSGLTSGFADDEIDDRWETVATGVTAANATTMQGFGVAPVPEPSVYAAALGLLALGLVAWRRRR